MFLTADQYIRKANEDRKKLSSNKVCSYYVDFLDDYLVGIHPSELVVIGSETGKGKTTLVSSIAVKNALAGKRIVLFKLEGDINEFSDVEKWKFIVDNFKGEFNRNFSYPNYRLNKIKGIEELDGAASEYIKDRLKNIVLYNKKVGINKNNLIETLESIKDSADLVIIDHLHYFDMLAGENENKQEKEIMKSVNEAVERFNVPIILVSHLRKPVDKRQRVPSIHDLMGSSDIGKIAHTVITTAPYFEMYDINNNKFPTFFSIPKSRVGVPGSIIGIKTFDGVRKEYLPGYELVRKFVAKSGEEVLQNVNEEF